MTSQINIYMISLFFLVFSLVYSNSNFKTEIEYNFNSNSNFEKKSEFQDTISQYFHIFREKEIYLNTGTRMKCMIPSKITNTYNTQNKTNLIKSVSTNLALKLLRSLYSGCTNSAIKEWYYFICPFHSAEQLLSYKKRDETKGTEYEERFLLGKTDIKMSKDELFHQILVESSSFLFKYQDYLNISYETPYVYTWSIVIYFFFKLARFFKSNLDILKNSEVYLVVKYSFDELIGVDGSIKVDNDKTLDECLKFKNRKSISFKRKIVRLVSDDIAILESQFPVSKLDKKFRIEKIKKKYGFERDFSYSLNIFGDYIYCFKCEFLLYYSVGDTFFLRNSNYSENSFQVFKGKSHHSRTIIEIINNEIIRVSKPLPQSGLTILPSAYFVVDSFNYNFNWKIGLGLVKAIKNVIIGTNSNFFSQLQKGDILVLIDIKKNHLTFHINPTNQKFFENNYCIVKKILSRNILITENPCMIPENFEGIYIFNKRSSEEKQNSKPVTLDFEELKNTFTNKKDLVKNNSDTKNTLETEKGTSKEVKLTHRNNNNYNVETFEPKIFNKISFSSSKSKYYSSKYISHESLILKSPRFSVFKLQINKVYSGHYSFLRILLHTDMETYLTKSYNENDYEILLNSDQGIAIKKLGEIKLLNESNFQFIETGISSLFTLSTELDLIFLEDKIYINSLDSDYESSVKIDFQLQPNQTIKYISFDSQRSNNTLIKNLSLVHHVESNYLYNIDVFEKRRLLDSNALYREVLTDGDMCEPTNLPRKAIVEYTCDESGIYDLHIESIEEESVCVYKYLVKTNLLCNPVDMMRYKIQNAIAKVKCSIDNDLFNNPENESLFYSQII